MHLQVPPLKNWKLNKKGNGLFPLSELRCIGFFSLKTMFYKLRACLHGGGGPQIGEVTCGGSPHLSCKRDQIKMKDYMDSQVTSRKRVTSPTWGPPAPCKQALNQSI